MMCGFLRDVLTRYAVSQWLCSNTIDAASNGVPFRSCGYVKDVTVKCTVSQRRCSVVLIRSMMTSA